MNPAAAVRQRSTELAKSLLDIRKARESLKSSRLEPVDPEFALKRFIVDADAMCTRFQSLDDVMAGTCNQAKPFCTELAGLLANLKEEYSDVVSDLLTFVCRALRVQESFSVLLGKAKRDVKDAQKEVAEQEEEKKNLQVKMAEQKSEAERKIAELEQKLEDMRTEEARLELEASRPSWQWQQEAADPQSTIPSKDWFEAELEFLKNRNSALELRNTMLTTQKTDDLERAKDQERMIASLEARVAELAAQVTRFEEAIPVRTEKGTQSQSEVGMWVESISPKVIFRGGNAVSPPFYFSLTPIKSGLGEPYSIPYYELGLPEHFKIIFEDLAEIQRTNSNPHSKHKSKESKKGLSKSGKVLKKPSKKLTDSTPSPAMPDGAIAAPAQPTAVDAPNAKRPISAGAKKKDKNPFKKIVETVEDSSAVVLNLRTTTKWIGEVWFAKMATLHGSGVVDMSVNDLEHCSDDEVGRFIWELFLAKYGGVNDATMHVGDLIHSMRYYRDENPRCRILAEYAGVDVRRSARSFRIHLWVMEKLSPGFRPDEDNGVVWVPLPLAESVARACVASRAEAIGSEEAQRCLQSVIQPQAVDDPLQPGDKIIDSDLAAEAITNLLMRVDVAVLEEVFSNVCEGAEVEEVVSLPRFMGIMQSLNGHIDPEELVAFFERPVPSGPRGYITNEELMQFARDHPMSAQPAQASRAHRDLSREDLVEHGAELDPAQEQIPNPGMLRAALDHFWYSHALRIRTFLQHLRAKEQRVADLIEKFSTSYSSIEADPSGSVLASCWIFARFLQGETMPQHAPPTPWPKPKPRPSFFRSKERQLHIMKQLLPRAPPLPRAASPPVHHALWDRGPDSGGEAATPAQRAPVVQLRDRSEQGRRRNYRDDDDSGSG